MNKNPIAYSKSYTMKKFLLAITLVVPLVVFSQDAAELHKNGRAYMQNGDHANAIIVLNRALALQPENMEIAKDLALNYYYSKEYTKAISVLRPLIDKETADDHCYQIAGDSYLALDQKKEAEKIYRKGIRKVTNNGALYNELGQLLWSQGDYSAIKQWEKGIESDPAYPGNYYNAARYYYLTTDRVWSLIYGEIFLNMDPQNASAPEVKNFLFEGYKKLFADANLEKHNTEKNSFVGAFLATMNKQSSVANSGITPETLTMIRTRFILDWSASHAGKFPFRLFDLQKQLIQDGLFEAYNQWIFGAAQNLATYQTWVNNHPKEYNELIRFRQNRVFRIPAGQYYH